MRRGFKVGIRGWLWILVILGLAGCAAVTPAPRKIALLAPFEGQYREIGYEALYAAQLALHESETGGSYLILPLDDGGTISSARERAAALRYDDSIVFVLALGPYATHATVQAAYGDLPGLLVGYWPSVPHAENIAVLSADLRDGIPALSEPYPISSEALIGGEMLSLPQFDTRLNCTVWSSIARADEAFTARYGTMTPFAPPPRLIAPLTYQGTRVALAAIQQRVAVRDVQGAVTFDEAGYWQDAPRYKYGCGLL